MSAPIDDDREESIRRLIQRAQVGDRAARDELVAMLYDEFRAIAHRRMAHERSDHTWQTTALVHEALRKLLTDNTFANSTDRIFLIKAASRAMDQVLIDHARHRNRQSGPGGRQAMSLDQVSELQDGHSRTPLDEVIERLEGVDRVAIPRLIEALKALDKQHERAALVVRYRFLLRMTIQDVANELGISQRTVDRDWDFARAWLHARLKTGDDS